jgi:hypothetical protein
VRERHYSPQLSRLVVCALYHEAKARKKPMTHLVDEILRSALDGSDGMAVARETFKQGSLCEMREHPFEVATDEGASVS